MPLAGFTAYFASRPLVESRLLRAWAAVVYAFLPAAAGALAGGRVGTAVLAVLLPLLARAGVAAAGLAHRPGTRGSWRATWAYALLLTVTTAFTPVVWPIALVLALAVLALRRADLPAYGLRFLAQLGTPCWSWRPGRCPCCRSASSPRPAWTTAPPRPPRWTCSAPAPAAPARCTG